MRILALIAIACGLLLAGNVKANDTSGAANANVKIMDNLDHPVAAAGVTIGNAQGTTASDGTLFLSGINPGDLTVTVTKVGYFSEHIGWWFFSNETKTVIVRLNPEPAIGNVTEFSVDSPGNTVLRHHPIDHQVMIGQDNGLVLNLNTSASRSSFYIADRVGHPVLDLAYSPDGRNLAVVGDRTGHVEFALQVSGRQDNPIAVSGPTTVVFLSNDEIIVGTKTGDIQRRNVHTGAILATRASGICNGITSLQLSADRRTLLSNDIDGMPVLWDAASLEVKRMLPHTVMANVARLLPNGTQVAIIPHNAPNMLQVWNLKAKKPKLVASLRSENALYDLTAFSYRGDDEIGVGTINNYLVLLSFKNNKFRKLGEVSTGSTLSGDVTASPDSKYLYAGVEKPTVVRWRIH